jgi:hypothetical protein
MARDRLSGLFQAEVIDTSTFRERGQIRIRTLGFNYEDEEKGWEWARVMMPFGGLENMGMQFLPPIGAVGFIMYERGDPSRPIWVGTVMHYWGKQLEDGTAQPVEAENETDFVIKTQYTKREDREVSSTENKVENVLKMNENELTLTKFHQSDQYEYLNSSYNAEEKAANMFKLTDDEIKTKLRTSDNSEDRTISITEDEIKVEYADGKKITITEDEIFLDQDGVSINVSKDGEVNVTADSIILNGENGTGIFYEIVRDFVNNAFNSHTHGTPAGPSSPPVTPFTNISQGKSKHVKLS